MCSVLCFHARVTLQNYCSQQKLVNAVNNLVEKDELVAWSRMKEERRGHTITKLLHTVEESALTLANDYKTPTELEIKATDIGEIGDSVPFIPTCVWASELLGNCNFYISHRIESRHF